MPALTSMTVYAGRFTTNNWDDFVTQPGSIRFLDGYLLAVAPSWALVDRNPRWALESELELVKFVGGQSQEEVDGAVSFRWRDFPRWWGVRTTAAFGIGPSWASRVPRLEQRISGGGSRRFLVYWFVEGTFSPHGWGRWDLVVRLHHRSSAYGLVAPDGGSNIPALGVRRRF